MQNMDNVRRIIDNALRGDMIIKELDGEDYVQDRTCENFDYMSQVGTMQTMMFKKP